MAYSEKLPLVRRAHAPVAAGRAPWTAVRVKVISRWRVSALLLAFAVALAGCALGETPEDGLQAFNQGKYRDAVRIWRKLARENNSTAQFHLGRIYELGTGVPRDYETAARYYTMAARYDNPYAQGNLAVLYAYGRGVPEDLVQSYAWSTLAAANYAKWARDERAAAYRNLNIVASRMDAAELQAARQLVEKLHER